MQIIKKSMAKLNNWKDISDLVPQHFKNSLDLKKTGLAGIFSASLELSKEGLINIKQNNKVNTLLIKEKNE